MKNRTKDKGRLPPFVPLLKETLNTSAWRNLSHGARSLYVALKARYSITTHNNGRLYLSQRDAMKELGSGTNEIARWYRELQHFGFIVMTKGGFLGLNGKGFAPHWRLTELGCRMPKNESIHDGTRNLDFATNDFLKWDGAPFKDTVQARPSRRRKTESRNGIPLRGVTESRYIEGKGNPVTVAARGVTESRYIVAARRKRESRYISRLTTPPPSAVPSDVLSSDLPLTMVSMSEIMA